MAAVTLLITDPKATDSAGINLSTATYTSMVSGATNGLEYAWEGTSSVLLKNGNTSPATFTFVVPVPSGSGLSAIGSTPTSKAYSVAAGVTHYVPNADAFRNPTTGKVTFTVNIATCSAIAIAQ